VSHVLLWQPSECVHLIVNCVILFSENKYDDDDVVDVFAEYECIHHLKDWINACSRLRAYASSSRKL